jgi:hypothetical protein
MSNLNRKPIEKAPTGLRLSPFWYAQQNYGIPYRPKDKPKQEDWESVARQFGVGVRELIFFNFLTNDPKEVNWYLRNYTGCNKPSPSGNNWMFSNSANPGIIYVPPAEDRITITFAPEKQCFWTPNQRTLFMQRLRVVSQSMSGEDGARIKKLVQVILRVGYPRCLDLWYYNDMNVTEYVDWKTSGAALRNMTKATQGTFPFDGASGLYTQSADERGGGMWRIHAVKDLFDEFTCGDWDAAALKSELEGIDDLMYKGWYQMTLVGAKTAQGGGGAYDPAVERFLHHVNLLTLDDNSLYAAFRQ